MDSDHIRLHQRQNAVEHDEIARYGMLACWAADEKHSMTAEDQINQRAAA